MAKSFKIVFVIFVFLVFLLYSFKLDFVPVHLNQDEMMFALNALGIAETGADYYGNKWPFYFWHLGSFWATPIIVYLTAVFLKFLPFSEATIRLSSAFLGTLNVALLMYLTHLIFRKNLLTLLAGILIAFTPVHFIHSRLLLDNLYTVPFVLLWLIFLKRENYFLAGLSLGVGFHSYHAAKIVMPLYFLLSVIYVYFVKQLKIKNFAGLLLGFLIPILVFIPWLKKHPDTILNQVSYISSIDKSVDPARGYWGILSSKRVLSFVSNYFTYFSPKILFTEGDRSLIHSTGRVGAFAFPIVFLLVFGIIEALRDKDKFSKLILFGFLTFPVASAIVNDPQRISRSLVVIPFVILLSVYGIKFMLESKKNLLKPFLYFIFVLCTLYFVLFVHDYFGPYRVRAWRWFNGDIGGAYESTIKSTKTRPTKRIYIDNNIYFAENYFDFYQKKFGADLKNKTLFFDTNYEDFTTFPEGSLVVTNRKVADIRNFEIIEIIRELDGTETFFVYWRDEK